MGISSTKPATLSSSFKKISSWDLKNARKLLNDYKEKDLDFGLDVGSLADLLHGDKEWAESIITAFGSTNGIVNALAFINGVILLSAGSAVEKAELVFDALDFDATEQISMDEMTIIFLCCARGLSVVSGVGTVPPDEELESITLQAYRELNKSSAQPIFKSEFTKWINSFLGKEAQPSIEKISEKFGLTIPKSVEVSTEEQQQEEGTQPVSESREAEAPAPSETVAPQSTAEVAEANQQVEVNDPTPAIEEVPPASSTPVEETFVTREEAPTPSYESNFEDAPEESAHEEVTFPQDTPQETTQAETESVQEVQAQLQDLSVSNEPVPVESVAESGFVAEENAVAETTATLPESQNFDAFDQESLEYATEAGHAPSWDAEVPTEATSTTEETLEYTAEAGLAPPASETEATTTATGAYYQESSEYPADADFAPYTEGEVQVVPSATTNAEASAAEEVAMPTEEQAVPAEEQAVLEETTPQGQ